MREREGVCSSASPTWPQSAHCRGTGLAVGDLRVRWQFSRGEKAWTKGAIYVEGEKDNYRGEVGTWRVMKSSPGYSQNLRGEI